MTHKQGYYQRHIYDNFMDPVAEKQKYQRTGPLPVNWGDKDGKAKIVSEV